MAKRSTQCTVCGHREHAGIDLALARGVSVTAIARRYKLGTDSLYRHSKAHLPPQLRAQLVAGPDVEGLDLDSLRETESQSLLANLIAIRRRLFASLDLAEEYGDAHMVTRVTAQLHTNLQITGSLLGDLGHGSTTINNVLIMPEYVALRVELVRALAPHPQALKDVVQALRAIEDKAADAITADKRDLAS